MTLTAIDEINLTGSIRSANDYTTATGLVVDNGETITAVVETYDTPTYISPQNCSITINTVGDDSTANNSTPTVTTMVVSFANSVSGNFSTYIYQNTQSKLFQISGYFTAQNSSDPAQEMTMSGDNPPNSVQLEIGGVAGKQISLNDYGSRILANGTSATTGYDVELLNMYGKTYTPSYPHGSYNSANDTFTDTDIPAPNVVGSISSNTQITGTEYWRRVTLTYTGTAGTKYLHISAQLDGNGGTAQYFRGDAQFASYAVNDTLYPFELDNGSFQPGWKTMVAVPPTASNPDEWNESESSVITSMNNGSSGRFVIRSINSPTGSQGTGRLYNIAQGFPNNNNTSRGYGFFETSSSTTTFRVSNQYYHAKSPGYYLNTGDTIDVYYGVDCASLAYIKFAII